jgi:hypothetical protein
MRFAQASRACVNPGRAPGLVPSRPGALGNGAGVVVVDTGELVLPRDAKGIEMTNGQRASERITEEVTSWPGVLAGPGRRGEFAFKVGGREIGHLHGDEVAHFGFPNHVWTRLFEHGRIDYHPILPGKPGFGARRIETEEDVRDVIELMRLNYERMSARRGVAARAAAA